MSLCIVFAYISKTRPPILMKLCMTTMYIPRMVYVKFQKIPFTNKKFSGKTGFYSSLYISLYYRNIMSSICETAKHIELKFYGKLSLGPGIV